MVFLRLQLVQKMKNKLCGWYIEFGKCQTAKVHIYCLFMHLVFHHRRSFHIFFNKFYINTFISRNTFMMFNIYISNQPWNCSRYIYLRICRKVHSNVTFYFIATCIAVNRHWFFHSPLNKLKASWFSTFI